MKRSAEQWREHLRRAPEAVRIGTRIMGRKHATKMVSAEHVESRSLAFGLTRDEALDNLADLLSEVVA